MIDIKIDTSSCYGAVSNILTYIITITNKSNVPVEDIIIKSNLDEQLKFIENSVKVDDIIYENANIICGINIGDIPVNSLKQVMFDAKIVRKLHENIKVKFLGEYKYPSENNNKKYWEKFECKARNLKIYNLDIKVDTSSPYGILYDILTYVITITNKSNEVIEDVIIKSILDEQLRFIKNSAKIDNVIDREANITSGINIGDISPNAFKKIEFNAKIIKKIYENIQVKFLGEYKYPSEIEGRTYGDIFEYKAKDIKIYNPNLNIEYSSDSKKVQLNNEITYFLDISNTGELDLINLYLVNKIPNNLKIIEGSFSINGKYINSINIKRGIILGNLKKNEHKKISYKVRVISGSGKGKITTRTKVIYSFMLNNENIYKESNEYSTSVLMSISNFKLINISHYFYIQGKNAELEYIDEIIPEVKIEKYKVIKTQRGKSLEGQNSNLYKLIIHGKIKEIVKYENKINLPTLKTSYCETQFSTLKTSYCETQFSTYVVLPRDFDIGTTIDIDTKVDNINFYIIGKNSYFRSLDLLIIAKVSQWGCHTNK